MAEVPKIIDAIIFGLLSPDDIRKMAKGLRITTADTYDEDGLPIDSGLMDRRLGTIEPGQRCATCGNMFGQCPGHFGYIELARPVIHVGFVKLLHQVLRATCRYCGRILLTPDEFERYSKLITQYQEKWGQLRQELPLRVLKKAVKTKDCPWCLKPQGRIKLDKPVTFYEDSIRLTPLEVRSRLERILDEDVKLLGLNPAIGRPEWMVLTVLPVPPISVRPSITLESGVRSEDDLTHKLVDILRINERLKENIEFGAPQLIIDDLWDLLQYHVTTYFDNEVSGIPSARHRSGRPLRTLAQRLKGKEGRFRSNLSGKRVDFSARTVISPDPNISINEVGVPVEIAKILTVPEKVTPWNIEEMKELCIRGPNEHPGANYIIRLDGRRIDLRFPKDTKALAESLQPGYVVERHIKDGDIALFNRQPSLHRMSVMAHVVKVLPYKTFRLNLCVCPPYNADFDGDEMNLHIPQSVEARAEARILMLVQELLLSPRFGGPIIGATQDFVCGAFLLTRKSTFLTRGDVYKLLMAAGYDGELPEPVIKKPEELWTGKQVVSLLLPDGLNYSLRASVCNKCRGCMEEDCPYDAYVMIKDGNLLTGVIDKRAIGAQQAKSVLHRVIKDEGSDAGRLFIDDVFKAFLKFIDGYGFSLGIENESLPREAFIGIRDVLGKAEGKVGELIEAYKHGELEPLPGKTLEETLEMRIVATLAEARERAGVIASNYLGMENNVVIMAKTGARASMIHLTQMTSSIGQQLIRGERIMRGYRRRTLPHFKQGDLGVKAHGFAYNSYKTGLDPLEFFFHAIDGREGLVDTAVRTSYSGYMQRRLINALQDVRVAYDGTVRTADDGVIQFKYGDDGVDPSKSDHGEAVNIDRIIEKVVGSRG